MNLSPKAKSSKSSSPAGHRARLPARSGPHPISSSPTRCSRRRSCENTPRMKSQFTPRALRYFQRRLLDWFRTHQRDLPWRRSRDPYRVWVAEVMLQQTRIAAVRPYYRRFLRRFPRVESLASAPQDEVLKLWSGLGYYSRARNLHRTAKEIVAL